MKKIIQSALLISVLHCLYFSASAQNSTASATLTVTLSDVLDIHIGSAAGTSTTVALPAFNTASAYQNGVQSVQPDHLYIIASKAFTIQASSTNLTSGASPDANHTISAGGINVVGTDGSQGSTNKPTTTYNNINLATTAANFIVATGGTPLYKYSVTYTIGGSTRATNFINKATGTYTATVTYTIIP